MKKSTVILLTVAAFIALVFAAAMIAACGKDESPRTEGGLEAFDDYVSITLTNTNGETSYDIYKSDGAYGEYELVASGYEKSEYIGSDKWAYYRVDGYADGRKVSSRVYSYERELFGDST